jgi:F-type H+-transporting ATPase subunit epsilon
MAAGELQCVVVTPERALLDVPADSVVLPMYDGELGIYPRRAPLIGRLGYGEVRIRKGNVTTYVYVEGGFVQMKGNVVSVLTARAMKAEELNKEKIEATLATARTEGKKTAESIVAEQKARAQLRVARRAPAKG